MANATYNQGVDYFGLETATSNALKVKSSEENRSKQSSSGQNTYGDTRVVDSFGETAEPSATYEVVGDVSDSTFTDIGGSLISNPTGFSAPLCVGGLSFTTSTGQSPTMTMKGQLVQSGATRLRKYSPVAFKLSPRHRAQNCVCTKSGSTYTPILSIKKGANDASDSEDYGLESVSGDVMSIVFTTSMPKGVLMNYDLHGDTLTVTYTINWYASTAPTIELTASAVTAGFTLSSPVSKSDPENGYTQYTVSASLPLVGSEMPTQASA